MVKSLKNLQAVLKPYLEKAMEATRDEVFEILSNKIVEYYEEPVFDNNPADEPRYYSRTGQMLSELTAFPLSHIGNGLGFEVGWPDSYYSYQYPGTPSFGNRNNRATGYEVLSFMNSGSHGGTVNGEHNYFDEALEEIDSKYGGVTALFKIKCKEVGIPIK